MKNHKCPRCSGQMFVDSYDEFDEEHCLTCGYVQYTANNLKNEKSCSSSFYVEHNIDNCKVVQDWFNGQQSHLDQKDEDL